MTRKILIAVFILSLLLSYIFPDLYIVTYILILVSWFIAVKSFKVAPGISLILSAAFLSLTLLASLIGIEKIYLNSSALFYLFLCVTVFFYLRREY
ncbi:hypothetical protein KKC62_02380 [Patescibacteria group bacterium]|nr:hypothetical protein [Patescibacteria group bacterium]MBU1953027.1 hypothetical protein [Patescibacteria group bacterium]